MTQSSPMHLTAVATVVVPVADQERALAFYVGVLGLEVVNDFTYETGERWVEVAAPGAVTRLVLVPARPGTPAGVETGIALGSTDVEADLATLTAAGAALDAALLPEGEVVWWSGAPLAGLPPQFRFRDPDGNAFLLVQAPEAEAAAGR